MTRMKKILYTCLAVLSLNACEIAREFNDDVILPPELDNIISAVNYSYITNVLDQMEALQEILYYIQTGENEKVHVYGSTYEVDHVGGTFKQERASKSDPAYWRCSSYDSTFPDLKFVSDNGYWVITPVDEKNYTYTMRIRLQDDRSVNDASFELSGIRADYSGDYYIRFRSLSPIQCRWITSDFSDDARILSLNGSMHYDICKGDIVIDIQERTYTF